jgi:hypothetical protein
LKAAAITPRQFRVAPISPEFATIGPDVSISAKSPRRTSWEKLAHRSLPREPALRRKPDTKKGFGERGSEWRFQRQFPHAETDEYLRNAA